MELFTSEPGLDMVFLCGFLKKKKKMIYLAVPDLSCGMQDLQLCYIWDPVPRPGV